MHHRPVRECIQRGQPLIGSEDDSVRDAVKRMAEHSCSSILICDGETLRGIFTERDLLVRVVAADRDPDKTKLGEVMSADPVDADVLAAQCLFEPGVEGAHGRAVALHGFADVRGLGVCFA